MNSDVINFLEARLRLLLKQAPISEETLEVIAKVTTAIALAKLSLCAQPDRKDNWALQVNASIYER